MSPRKLKSKGHLSGRDLPLAPPCVSPSPSWREGVGGLPGPQDPEQWVRSWRGPAGTLEGDTALQIYFTFPRQNPETVQAREARGLGEVKATLQSARPGWPFCSRRSAGC